MRSFEERAKIVEEIAQTHQINEIHAQCSIKTAFWTDTAIAVRENEAGDHPDHLKSECIERVCCGHDESGNHDEGDLLHEVVFNAALVSELPPGFKS